MSRSSLPTLATLETKPLEPSETHVPNDIAPEAPGDGTVGGRARFLMTSEEASYVGQMRVEIATMVEADQMCPILFETFDDLTDWSFDHGIGGGP